MEKCPNCGYPTPELTRREQTIVEAVSLMLQGRMKQGQEKIININA